MSTTSGTSSRLVGGGVGFGLKRSFGEGSTADAPGDRRAPPLGYVVLRRASPRAWTATCSGPTSRRAARRPARRYAAWPRGLVDGAAPRVDAPAAPAHALAAIGAHRFFYGISTISAILLFRNYFNDPDDVDARPGRAGHGLRRVGARLLRWPRWSHPRSPTGSRKHDLDRGLLRAGRGCRCGRLVVAPAASGCCCVGAFVLGVAAQGSKICVDTIVQASVDDAFRGRVFSFYDVLFNIAFVSAAAFGALALPADGNSRAVYAVVAVGYAVTALVYGRARGTSATATAPAAADPRPREPR